MTRLPTQITFRHLTPSETLEADIHERVAKLEQAYAGIMGCRVLVELPHRHRQAGKRFHVRVEVTVPGGDPIIVSQDPSRLEPLKDAEEAAHRKDSDVVAEHRDAHVAVHAAFAAARRRLQDFARVQRKAVKAHEVPSHGQVVEISRPDGFGFIQAGEQLVYFNRASVLDDAFDALVEGARVAFVEERGEKGSQASTVRVLGIHHYATLE
jgi:cold shock CspA family protein